MGRPPFAPAGAVARWRLLYDLLKGRKVDDIVTYDEMAAALELDPVDERQKIVGAIRRAAKEFEVVDKHAIHVVPNKGYRIVKPAEHIDLAQRHQRRAGRSLVRGHSKVVNVDLSGLDQQTRNALEVLAKGFAVQMDFNRRFAARQSRTEEALATAVERQDRTEEELAELRARLERIEGGS